MVLLLGASGFVGRAFAAALLRCGRDFIPLSRRARDYTRFDVLFDFVRRTRPRFVINAAGMRGDPDGETCETAREEALAANTLLPQTIARVCRLTRTPWGHVSSGCIYRGARVLLPEGQGMETDLKSSAFRRRLATMPETIGGYTETDEPNFSFRRPPCSFYSGTKALAEEALVGTPDVYIWRPGVAFNSQPVPQNLLWRLCQRSARADDIQPLSHVEDFARACLTLWESGAPYGIYNVVNPGIVTSAQIQRMIGDTLALDEELDSEVQAEVHGSGRSTIPRAECVLDTRKLEAAGARMRPVTEALAAALQEMASRVQRPALLQR